MIAFRRVEFLSRLDRSHDRFKKDFRRGHLRYYVLGNTLLFFIAVEDDGAILLASIIALTIERGRIMNREEDVKQFAIVDSVGIESDSHDFDMTGVAVAHLAVGCLVGASAPVAGLDVANAG